MSKYRTFDDVCNINVYTGYIYKLIVALIKAEMPKHEILI